MIIFDPLGHLLLHILHMISFPGLLHRKSFPLKSQILDVVLENLLLS